MLAYPCQNIGGDLPANPGRAWQAHQNTYFHAAYLNYNNSGNQIFLRFDPNTSSLVANQPNSQINPGNQHLPLVAVEDDTHAIGFYAPPNLNPINSGAAKRYQYFAKFSNTDLGQTRLAKMNHVVVLANDASCINQNGSAVVNGAFSFRTYIVVGSKENVRVAMAQLHQVLRGNFQHSLNPVNYLSPICQ
jgi:hypothetical protein